jgi:hypothetical protein
MRSFPRFAALRYPALAAMLLLSFAPSVSRLLAAPGAAPGAGPGWVQLCTMTGLKQVWFDGASLPSKDDHGGDDCGYCPLLGAMAAAVVVFWLFPADRRDTSPRRPLVARWIPGPILGGLGARGPPALA